ncbi:MAG: RNA polymerase sigma factor [Elusimicrobiota bacterium]|nr:RNA polymerase sigma factor [Elusimicrobiota bacterium]
MEHPDRKELIELENSLISRFIGGDAEAFAGLVDIYKDRVHQFILCILGPDREAEDIAQEVFIQIYKSLGAFRRESSFGTWAYSLTRNVCRRRLRDRGREAGLFSGDDGESGGEPRDAAPSVEIKFENEETGKIIRAAVDGLSPLHRSVIFLSCWEHLSYKEIAAALDIPIGTVRSRIHNALAALSTRLKPVLAEEKQP